MNDTVDSMNQQVKELIGARMNWISVFGAALLSGAVCGALGWLADFISTAGRSAQKTRRGETGIRLLVTGFLFALAMGPLVATLKLGRFDLFLSLWLWLFVLGFCLSMIEAVVFTEGPSPIQRRHVLGIFGASAIVGGICAVILSPSAVGSAIDNIKDWGDRLGWVRFGACLVGTAIAFMVAYCTIGSVAWHFVRPYYTDPKYGLRLRIPSGPYIILLQLGRGIIAIFAIVPVIASSSAHGWDWWARCALALSVTMGVNPLVQATEWPMYLRVAHGIEIVVFACVYSFAVGMILGI